MKNLKRLLSSALALVLLFCSMSAGMVVLAAEEEAAVLAPFASFSVGGQAIDLSNTDSYDVVGYGKTSAQVEWTLNEGWEVSEAYYYDYSGTDFKKIDVKSGDTVKVPKDENVNLSIMVQDDQYNFKYYSISIYQGKARLLDETIWMGTGNFSPICRGFSGASEVVSIKSSKTGVIKVKKGNTLWECTLTAKSAGKAKVTVKVKINGKEKSFSANYTVKKYPNALASLKVDGKAVNLKKNKFYFKKKVKKNSVKLEYKAAKGWKVKSCSYYDGAKGKTVKIKSGGKVNTKMGTWVAIQLTKGKDSFWYDVELPR